MLCFRQSERSRTHIRVIDEVPNVLMEKLVNGKSLIFKALPEPEDNPKEEKSSKFLSALEEARLTDEIYRGALKGLEGDDPKSNRGGQIERALRDRVREQLKMPKRPSPDCMSISEYARLCGFEPDYDLAGPTKASVVSAKHSDNEVQTLLLPDQMERKLSGLADRVRTMQQETGINTLYCAFGFLEWYESSSSDETRLAPLLLHPLNMERKLVRDRYRYSISSRLDEETQINITLAARLKGDFGIKLPDLEEDEIPEHYFQRIRRVIKDQKRWQLRRYLTVGHFAFARLVMFNDLDPGNWAGKRTLASHPVLARLLDGGERGDAFHLDDYNIDDPKLQENAPVLIAGADSSQCSAVIDVMSGRDLVIEGPPGTGKSQTITNIIGASLAAGKTVLFVSEKMAALEVVKKRLDEAEVGDFCLELHSTRAQKKEVLESLRQRLQIQYSRQSPPGLQLTLDELEDLKSQLSLYAEVINQSFGKLGKSIHDLLWLELRHRRSKQLPDFVMDFEIPNAAEISALALERARSFLEMFELQARGLEDRFKTIDRHPWNGVCRDDIGRLEQEKLILGMREWASLLQKLAQLMTVANQRVGSDLGNTMASLRSLIESIEKLPRMNHRESAEILGQLNIPKARQVLKKTVADLGRYRGASQSLKQSFPVPSRAIERAESIGEAVQTVCDWLPKEANIGDLDELISECITEKARWDAFGKLTKSIAVPLGIRTPMSLREAHRVIEAARFVRQVPRSVLLGRVPNLLDERTSEVLRRGHIRSQEIQKQLLDLRKSFELDLSNPGQIGILRQHAGTLRAATWISQWSKPVRQAARAHRALQRMPGKKSRQDKASDLSSIASCLEVLHAFLKDSALITASGDKFSGLETPFNDLLAVTDYVGAVRTAFAVQTETEIVIRRCLLEGSLDLLDEIRTLGAETGQGSICEIADFKGRALDMTLEENACALDQRIGDLSRFKEELSAAGILLKVKFQDLPGLASELADIVQLGKQIEGNGEASRLLGENFKGTKTDEDAILESLEMAGKIESCGLPDSVCAPLFHRDYAERFETLQQFRKEAFSLLSAEKEVRAEIFEVAALGENVYFGEAIEEHPIESVVRRVETSLQAGSELAAWIDFRRAYKVLESEGLVPLIEQFREAETAFKDLVAAYDLALYRTLVRKAFSKHPALARFGGISQETARKRFREIDRKVVALRRKTLVADLAHRKIDSGVGTGPKKKYTGLALIENEIGKEKRHIPLRDLLGRAGNAIQQMKPCFMMSPLSVAQFLSPRGVQFDLLVIDEASQMRPEEALCAIGRVDQVVIVGDPKQLPPTQFFDKSDDFIEGDDPDDAEDIIDSESILDLSMTAFRPARRLIWHYRSRHASLIAFSNERFYDKSLIVFPSPNHGSEFGVSCEYVGGIYRGGENKKQSVNPQEVARVVDEALLFMKEQPTRSLGIVTVNQPQRELIKEELDLRIRDDSQAREYMERWQGTLEPLFVKNLETVQGDERDVIFISTVYGPDENGKVMQRYGPINSRVGHRRLNVLFTRAKDKVKVFTSLRPSDVRIDEHSTEGVRTLRAYLEYALTGRLNIPKLTGREPQSDFQWYVMQALQEFKFSIVPELGVAGYFIDLAVCHPSDPESFLLGIECDGASYHSSKSARDRDRLRQEVLENLGWKIYRVWSTDWFNDPDRETRKLVAHINGLLSQTS